DGSMLVIAATNNETINAAVVADARARGILCSNAADPQDADFTFPAVLRLDDLTVAVDTAGASPSLAKRLSNDLREKIDPAYGRAAKTLGLMRDYIRNVVPQQERGELLKRVALLPLHDLAVMNPGDAQHCVDAHIDQLRGISITPSTNTAICASRASQLALTQTRTVAAKLALHGLATTILTVTTLGDAVQDRSLAAIGAESLFVKELELALRERRAHYAVHSCKDLPSALPEDMRLVALSKREDARDAFCSEHFESLAALPPGSKVGTSSMRRRAQLLAVRPDLAYIDIRGNIDTRLRKLREGQYDAIVLAMAGLNRLGIAAKYTVPFACDEMVPAVGQGALAVEMARGDEALAARIREALNDPQCELAILAERAALAALRGGCQAPIGIHARLEAGTLHLQAIVVSPDGTQIVRAKRHAPATTPAAAESLGQEVAGQLLASGAQAILAAAFGPGVLNGKRIVLPRTQERPSRIAEALKRDGAEVLEWRAGEAASALLGEPVPDMIVFPSSGSVQAAAALLDVWRTQRNRPAVAVMGPASAAAALDQGFPADVTASEANIEPLLAAVRAYFQ
ncbi:MAG: hydroxymethylbilane synthase, partial [Candidatus Eremiobacteraeota bacterium]|nr:hydroxymethylbilane synthase [Candidatus Eremiobacteraeota bacterium]